MVGRSSLLKFDWDGVVLEVSCKSLGTVDLVSHCLVFGMTLIGLGAHWPSDLLGMATHAGKVKNSC